MSSQVSLPGCAPTPTVNPAVAEADLRGDTALAILAYLAWAEAHGGTKLLLDGSVSKWLTSGRPDDPSELDARSLHRWRWLRSRVVPGIATRSHQRDTRNLKRNTKGKTMPITQETRDEISKRARQLEFLAVHAPSDFTGIMATVERDHAAAERALDLKIRENAVTAEALTRTAIGTVFGR